MNEHFSKSHDSVHPDDRIPQEVDGVQIPGWQDDV